VGRKEVLVIERLAGFEQKVAEGAKDGGSVFFLTGDEEERSRG
jgi:hypothetical protein